MENQYQHLILSYDNKIKNLILEYECWKMLASFYNGDKFCFSSKNHLDLIIQIYKKLHNPASLTICEILTLILYQIETVTHKESIPLLLLLLSDYQELNDAQYISYSDFSNLRSFVGKVILDLPMPTILKLLTSLREEVPFQVKVEEYCQSIKFKKEEKIHIKNLILESNFLLLLRHNKKNHWNAHSFGNIASQDVKECLSRVDLKKQIEFSNGLLFFSNDSLKARHKNLDSLSTQSANTRSLLQIQQNLELGNSDYFQEAKNSSEIRQIDEKGQISKNTGLFTSENSYLKLSKHCVDCEGIESKSRKVSGISTMKSRAAARRKYLKHHKISQVSLELGKNRHSTLSKFLKPSKSDDSELNYQILSKRKDSQRSLFLSTSISDNSLSKELCRAHKGYLRSPDKSKANFKKVEKAWTSKDEGILRMGMEKFGVGQWKNIIRSGKLDHTVSECQRKWKELCRNGSPEHLKNKMYLRKPA